MISTSRLRFVQITQLQEVTQPMTDDTALPSPAVVLPRFLGLFSSPLRSRSPPLSSELTKQLQMAERKKGNEPRGGKHAGVGPSLHPTNDATATGSIPQVLLPLSILLTPPAVATASFGGGDGGGSTGSNNKRLKLPPGFCRPS